MNITYQIVENKVYNNTNSQTHKDIKHTDVILTRYLYIYDEVCACFVVSLLTKRNYDEVLFWIDELYKSGFEEDCWDLIFNTYYNYYSLQSPKLENKIISYYKQYNCDIGYNDKYLLLLDCVKNLFSKSKSNNIDFIVYDLWKKYYNLNLNYFDNNEKSNLKLTIYRGRKPKWFTDNIGNNDNNTNANTNKKSKSKSNLLKDYYNIYASLHKKNFDNILYYMICDEWYNDNWYNDDLYNIMDYDFINRDKKYCLKNNKLTLLYTIIHTYFTTTFGLSSKKSGEKSILKIWYELQSIYISEHILLSLLCYLYKIVDTTCDNSRKNNDNNSGNNNNTKDNDTKQRFIFLKNGKGIISKLNKTYSCENYLLNYNDPVEVLQKRVYFNIYTDIFNDAFGFPLLRFREKKFLKYGLKDCLSYNWMYFAYSCPLWKERLDKYGYNHNFNEYFYDDYCSGVTNHNNNDNFDNIDSDFNDTKNKILFCEKYDYQIDEQKKYILERLYHKW